MFLLLTEGYNGNIDYTYVYFLQRFTDCTNKGKIKNYMRHFNVDYSYQNFLERTGTCWRFFINIGSLLCNCSQNT